MIGSKESMAHIMLYREGGRYVESTEKRKNKKEGKRKKEKENEKEKIQ
jgi:hypothetical protein